MEDAMNLVRQELGQDAVVVESKEVQSRRLLPWPSTRSEIQISAERKQRRSAVTNKAKYETKPARTIRTLAETNQGTSRNSRLLNPLPEIELKLAAALRDDVAPLPASNTSSEPCPTTSLQTPTNRFVEPTGASTSHSVLESLQQMIRRLERHLESTGVDSIPEEMATHFHQLLESEVDSKIAHDLISKLAEHMTSETPRSSAAVMATMTALIEREMRCAPPIQPKAGRREIVMLVGPTGVGKTTTVAKLAGRFHLQEGLRVGLITIDTYRVGAIEQLQTFAEILRIPMQIASNGEELRQAIDLMDDVDVILIDTAGRSPFDHQKMEQLRELVTIARPDHVMLTVSLVSGGKAITKVAEQFAVVDPTSVVVTKIDECHRHGALLSIAREIPYPVRYLTTGQDVPDHIEPSHPHRLARLILNT